LLKPGWISYEDDEGREEIYYHFYDGKVSPSVTAFYKEVERPAIVACLVSRSDRPGEGWCLYRYDDHPWLDFSRLDGKPGVIFAHKGGFIAKTANALSKEDALDLVAESVRRPAG